MNKHSLFLFPLFFSLSLCAQNDPWQQRVKYSMNVDVDVQTNRLTGVQKLEYWNNSPDTLDRVFYHLYWNAFQPGSMMDVRSRRQGTIIVGKDKEGQDVRDWDPRVEDRIQQLKPDEIGYERVTSLKMDGRPVQMKLHETILEVRPDRPILPHSKVTFDLQWESQVPEQIRRSGRDNAYTGVRYTMTQWYPKLCEYDEEGWHPTPYIGREFYGVWGDYDVTISIDKTYMLGGTGYLQNGAQVGFGYEEKGVQVTRPAGNKASWHFVAPNVHDFAWAADADYKHLTRSIPNGPEIHVLYQSKPTPLAVYNVDDKDKADFVRNWDASWKEMADAAVTVFPFIEKTFGHYGWKQYSFIHGGDGGMEYPMCTMLATYSLGSAFHEWMHSWYQGMLATNESMYPWMDEGFTEWATDRVEEYYRQQVTRKRLAGNAAALRASDSLAAELPYMHKGIYNAYFKLVQSGKEEPMTTHADHYNTNFAYTEAAYAKGGVFLEQLGYITGANTRDRILMEYYRRWRFRHPNATDFFHVAEKVSGMKLDWYREHWIATTHTIDYGIDSLWETGGATRIRLKNAGTMPMPVEVKLTFKDGTSEWHYVPLDLMFGAKQAEEDQTVRTVYPEWRWTDPTFEIQTKRRLTEITSVEIDPSQRMADVNRKNNKLDLKW